MKDEKNSHLIVEPFHWKIVQSFEINHNLTRFETV